MELYNTGDLYLIGGALREFLETGNIKDVKDIDVVIDTKETDKFDAVCKNIMPERTFLMDIKLPTMTLLLMYGE